MDGKPLLRQRLISGPRTAVIAIREDRYASSWRKQACHLDIFRVHQPDEILHYLVDAVLVEIPVVAETEEIELEALALDHPAVRDIADADFRKVGLPRNRTEAGEFRAVETYPVIILRMLVLEGFQHLRSIIHLVIGLVAEGLQTLKFSSF